jgi:hypothetical protein
VVARAVGAGVPFDRSPLADAARTQALVERLRAAGATEVRGSHVREWVVFRTPHGSLVQVYWSQARGQYFANTYRPDAACMAPLGWFLTVEQTLATALAV